MSGSIKIISVMFFLLMFCGCSVHTYIKLKNNTGERIHVFSSHTKKTIIIEANEEKQVDHTIGAITIKTDGGKEWEYDDVAVPDMRNEEYLDKGRKSFFIPTLHIRLFIEPNGYLYIMKKDENDVGKSIQKQPDGYPIKPIVN